MGDREGVTFHNGAARGNEGVGGKDVVQKAGGGCFSKDGNRDAT